MIEIDKALTDHGHPSTLRLVPAAAGVLVIDDDPDMLESLAMMLEDHGFRVLTANDGVRGLRVFREQRPAAVLTDIMMPEQDGIGAIMEMRREGSGVKIIAISGAGRFGKTDFLTIGLAAACRPTSAYCARSSSQTTPRSR
jgi:CheY-like chemotaxis protein